MTNDEILSKVRGLFIKVNEVLALMKQGHFIVAYEKLGGVLKVLGALGASLETENAKSEPVQPESK